MAYPKVPVSKLRYGYTHGTIFHSDDVFATALLLTLNPEIQISRILEVTPEMNALDAIVYDIGLGEFDHHQKDRKLRPIEDGHFFDKDGRMAMIPYCSFGLLWAEYGHELCPNDKAWKKVDKELVLPIDKADNGVESNLLSSAIAAFNPSWNSDLSHDLKFWNAVLIARQILGEYIARANAEVAAEDYVRNSKVVDGKILILDKYVPWQDIVVNEMPEIQFVVFPSMRGGYNCQTVPDAPGSFSSRTLFPTKWLGNPDASLGMTFCHPGNFLLATHTQEQSIECARISLGLSPLVLA